MLVLRAANRGLQLKKMVPIFALVKNNKQIQLIRMPCVNVFEYNGATRNSNKAFVLPLSDNSIVAVAM